MTDDDCSRQTLTDDSVLIRLAASGDRRAAGEFFARHLPTLAIIARSVAGSSHDPEDLLGEALVTVLSRWASGSGPTENVNAYVGQTMRNRMKDDFKSPRSRVSSLEDVLEPTAVYDPRIRRVEIESELALIHRAMRELSTDQQFVLQALIIDGRKPKDLQDQLNRPMTAIYSLSQRARSGLRRSSLRLLLEEDAPAECRATAQHLPEQVGPSPDTISHNRFTAHYQSCERCRRVWARFGTLFTLGVAPLLVVSNAVVASPESAHAVDHTSESQRPAKSSRPGVHTVVVRHLPVGLAIAATAAGFGILLVLSVTFVTGTWWFTPQPSANLTVEASLYQDDTIHLNMGFGVQGESWKIGTAEFAFSEEVGLVRAPEGWICNSYAAVISCRTSRMSAAGGTFAFSQENGELPTRFEVDVDARTSSGAVVTGFYRDQLPMERDD